MKNSKKAGIIFLITVFVLALSFKYIYLLGPVSSPFHQKNLLRRGRITSEMLMINGMGFYGHLGYR
ncbi:hypothetical protein [Natronospora cellulosivora (SeqCode)]